MLLSEYEVLDMIKLRQAGRNFKEISFAYEVPVPTVNRYIRNYETYGSSMWTDYPEPVTSSSACADTECVSTMSSPFSFWLSQRRSSQPPSLESLKILASLGDKLDNLSFYLTCPSDHTSSQS